MKKEKTKKKYVRMLQSKIFKKNRPMCIKFQDIKEMINGIGKYYIPFISTSHRNETHCDFPFLFIENKKKYTVLDIL